MAQFNMIPLVAEIFTSCFCGSLPTKGGTAELDELLLQCKQLFTGEMTALITNVGRRFKLQKVALWTHYLNFFVSLYDAESIIFTPIQNLQTPIRTESQLFELAKTLSLLINLAATNIGATENQQFYEQMLSSLNMRLPLSKRQPGSSACISPSSTTLVATAGTLEASKQLQSFQQQLQRQKSLPTTSLSLSGSPVVSDRNHESIGRASPSAASTTGSGTSPAVVVRRGEMPMVQPSKLWAKIRAHDEELRPFFSVSPTTSGAGSKVTVRWQLPPIAPPRYGCVGIFIDDGRPLIQREAYEVRTGLPFRQVTGHVDDFVLPTKLGAYVLAYFCTGHSDGLPFGDAFVARVRVVAAEQQPVKSSGSACSGSQQRTHSNSPSLQELAVLPPVGFAPCDTRQSQISRLTALATKDSRMRESLGLPKVRYDIHAALAQAEHEMASQKEKYEKNIRSTAYANVPKGVECVVLFTSKQRRNSEY
jgi:hypothetical protein